MSKGTYSLFFILSRADFGIAGKLAALFEEPDGKSEAPPTPELNGRENWPPTKEGLEGPGCVSTDCKGIPVSMPDSRPLPDIGALEGPG